MNDYLIAGLRGFKVRETVIPILERSGVPWSAITGPRRFPHIVSVRYEIFNALREIGCSYPKIGIICNREHTTVLHGVRRHRETMNENYN